MKLPFLNFLSLNYVIWQTDVKVRCMILRKEGKTSEQDLQQLTQQVF